ncbi:MAG: hypothetical protein Kow00124_28850 [Anaerolineae bacterium]
MASSLQTLIKILRLEQQKGYQNKAVIGGFARFAYHWSREAHGQAQTETHHALVDEISERLRLYETIPADQRPAYIEELIELASRRPDAEAHSPASEIGLPLPERHPYAEDAALEERAPEPPPAEPPPPQAEEFEGGADDGFDEFEFTAGEVETAPLPRTVRERRGYIHRPPVTTGMEVLEALGRPVETISGVGDKRAEQLERLGVHTIRDLLFLFPRRYDDYSRMTMIKDLRLSEETSIIGVLERVKVVQMKNGRSRVEAYLNDDSAAIRLNWFNPWIEKQLEEGEAYVVSGRVEQFLGRLTMNSPEIEPLDRESLHAGRVVPVYPLTQGLSGRQMRRLMKSVVDEWAPLLPDYLPLDVRERADLMDYNDAVQQAHFPDSWEDKEAALFRLTFDELFILHMAMLRARHAWQSRRGTPLSVDPGWVEAFLSSLPFELTGAQHRAIEEILGDIARDVPMNRLLQGDVGSGKTVVAALAMGAAVANGQQAALMAPTAILAEQHFRKISEVLRGSPLGEGVRVALLTSKISGAERDAIYAGLASGEIDVVIGTHALIQQGVSFRHLALAVIDEQHRFGVVQRAMLREKAGGGNPHLLVMTATPIPRTLALTLYADLDLTIIDELPPGRQPILTRVLQPKERERAYGFVRTQVQQGRQAYIICPLVEDSDKLDARSAVAEHERLQTTVFPDLRVGLLHGRMGQDEKDAVMEAFYRAELDILVSTTVIEVGIDVPNASVILIENAPRFGLAQLHQLRGRVGRGEHESYCLLISDKPFLEAAEDERLAILEQTNDGFKLAEKDWELRGAGDLLGTQQSGFGPMQFFNRASPHLLELIQHEARLIFERDPQLDLPDHHLLAHYVAGLAAATPDGAGDIS